MSAETFVLGSYAAVQRLARRLLALQFQPGRHWKVTVELVAPHGTQAQMAKIRAIVGEIAEHTGDDAGALYEQLLERRFGVEEIRMRDGSIYRRAAKRVSDMGRRERSDYIDWLQALAAEYGVRLRR